MALAELPPFSVVLGRIAIAALALHLALMLTGQPMPMEWRLWGRFAVMGAINNLLPFSLIFYGQTQIPSGLAAILNATTPLWTVLLAYWFTRDERLTPSRLAGVLAEFVSVVILLGPELIGAWEPRAWPSWPSLARRSRTPAPGSLAPASAASRRSSPPPARSQPPP